MQINTVKSIQPIEIILETQDEINIMHTIFNFIPIINALGIHNKEPWESLHKTLSGLSTPNYATYHEKLEDMIFGRLSM